MGRKGGQKKVFNWVRKRISRKIWIYGIRKRINNKNFTLISNNCIAGVIYSDLGTRFLSPTINLFIDSNDYLEFVKNIKYYMQCSIEEVKNSGKNYPVAYILPNDTEHIPIRINFLHYHSFEEAREKWYKRRERINWNNIFYIWEFYDDLYDINMAYEFDKLEIKKMLITHDEIEGLQSSVCVKCYEKGGVTGEIFKVKNNTGKRYLDEWDWVSFLNN